MNNRPGEFNSSYKEQLDNIYNQIVNREDFSYNMNTDALYQQYKQQYTQAGKNAMKDTIAQASALTGGYGNSYAATAGQQQYQNYLQELNNIVPTLYNQAYQRYQDEGANLLNQYSVAGTQYNNEYQQYRDALSDWQADRSFAQSNYQSERDYDYDRFNADRSYAYNRYNDERTFDYNQFRDNRDFLSSQFQNERTFDYQDYINNRNYWNQEYWNERNAAQTTESRTDTSQWSQTDTRDWSNTSSTQNTSSWSNTESLTPKEEDTLSALFGNDSQNGLDLGETEGKVPWYQRLANGVKEKLGAAGGLDNDIVLQIDRAASPGMRRNVITDLVRNGKISASDAADYANLFGISY